ncbi:hypothetical protein HGA88_00770 [Candidatus Roizmanbacteria bacterium]|nr:hypothetical protein [Candidatus Roizmanbacteria bacterium]
MVNTTAPKTIFFLLGVLLIISFLTRFYFLFNHLQAVTHDEADIYYSGYIVSQTGSDQFNNKLFLTTGFLTAKPSIPIYISAFAWHFLEPRNTLNARLPFTIINSFTPVLLFLLLFFITKNRLFAFFVFTIFNFSPWFSYLSVTGYEAPICLFFILLGSLILFMRWNIFFKYLLFIGTSFLAFNSYMGIKPVFPFILFVSLLISQPIPFNKINISKRKIIGIVLFSLILTCCFLFLNYKIPNTSLLKEDSEHTLVFLNKPKIDNELWYANLTSSNAGFMNRFISNKITIPFYTFFSNYMESFNLHTIFFSGDSSVYGTAGRIGLFYLTDFVFLILGLYSLRDLKNSKIYILMTLFLFGGLPIAFSSLPPTIPFRGLILLIPYITLIATGYLYVYKKYVNHLTLLFLIGLIIVNTFYYWTLFSTRIKVLFAEPWHIDEKNVIQKVHTLAQSNPDIQYTIYVKEPKPTFLLFGFYQVKEVSAFNTRIEKNFYNWNNITFKAGCPSTTPAEAKKEVIIVKTLDCPKIDLLQKTVIVPATNKSGNDYVMIH